MSVERAREMRARGMSYPAIAQALGVGKSTVRRWLNPDEAARNRVISRRWKDANREANRARDREFLRQPEMRGQCVNPACGQPRGTGVARSGDGYCMACIHAIAEVRRTLAEAMWADGWSLKEMGAAFGVRPTYFSAVRDRGWDLPYRYRNTKRQLAA